MFQFQRDKTRFATSDLAQAMAAGYTLRKSDVALHDEGSVSHSGSLKMRTQRTHVTVQSVETREAEYPGKSLGKSTGSEWYTCS